MGEMFKIWGEELTDEHRGMFWPTRLIGTCLTFDDGLLTSVPLHRIMEQDMRGLTAALTIASLLIASAAAMAQTAGVAQPNPFQGQGQ